MSGERPVPKIDGLSGIDNAVLGLLRQARAARDQEVLASATAALVSDNLAEQQASVQAILGKEALSLSARIRQLGKHPHLPTFLRSSEIKISKFSSKQSPYEHKGRHLEVATTPLLLATDPEFVDGSAVHDGYAFVTPTLSETTDTPTLFIDHRVVDKISKTEQLANRYVVTVSNKDAEAPTVSISGNEFTKYWHTVYSQRQADYQNFIHNYPQFDPENPNFDPTNAQDELTERYYALHELTRFDSKVDYPDGLYLFPLGLILKAQKLLAK